MIKKRKWLVLAVAAIGFIICIIAMVSAAANARRAVPISGAFFVSPRSVVRGFSPTEIQQMEENAYTIPIGSRYASIDVSGQSVFSRVMYTNHSYLQISGLHIIDGDFLPPSRSHESGIVLSESLAWRLFGSLNASGLYVRVNGVDYEVVGVASANNYKAWMEPPLYTEEWAYFISLLIQPLMEYNPITCFFYVQSMLESIGQSSFHYNIVDINRYLDSMARRPLISIAAFCLLLVLFLLTRVLFMLKRCIGKPDMMRSFTKTGFLLAATGALLYIITLLNIEFWMPGFAFNMTWFMYLTNIGVLDISGDLMGGLVLLDRTNALVNAYWMASLICLVVGGTLYLVPCARKNTPS